jgi:hypothetical protein
LFAIGRHFNVMNRGKRQTNRTENYGYFWHF